ncbi:energy transducer TonB [Rhizorhapis sp. SPR117]|uniref:energy transducer TonB n=1 Tax=Rhizorhapis sp. SPR117 TaxID=2912611 RepID=UPI001F280E27|nr:energy transducer TonB [Rhizorhapis sp. SPR117]
MAYADHSMNSSRMASIVIVALIHVVLGYAFVTGLGMKYVKKAAEQLNVIDVVEEAPPPEEEPPPPPPDRPIEPPPVVAPPPIVQTPAPPPAVTIVRTPPPVFTPTPVAPPAPPPPKQAAKAATPRGNPGSWVTPDDYPSRALREERAGTTGFRLSVGADGKVTDCQVTSSSGSNDLDTEACKMLMRRARFRPAEDTSGNPMASSYSSRVVWQIPR